MRIKAFLLASVIIFFMMAGNAFSEVELLTNGGFESSLAGWNHSSNVMVTDSHWGVDAKGGSLMAVLSPGGWFDSSLGQDFSTTGYTSAVVSFAYNLQAFDFSYCDFGQDSLMVSLGSHDLLKISLNDAFGGGSRIQGWNTFYRSFDSIPQGIFSIRFNVENLFPGSGDWGQVFTAYIDDVSIQANGGQASPIQEPSSLILLGSGLVAIAGWGRKKITGRQP